MFSLPPKEILKTYILKSTIVSAIGFFAVAIFGGLLLGWFLLYQLEQNERTEAQEMIEWFTELYETEGWDHAIFEMNDERELIWSDQEAYDTLMDEDPAYVIFNADNKAQAGYPGIINLADGPDEQVLEFEDDEVDVISVSGPIDDALSMVLVYPRTHEYYVVQESLRAGFFWLIVIVIPLTLITGLVLSARVFKRLNDINETVEKIGHDTDQRRVSLSPNNDEFDRLGANLNAMLDRIEELHRNIESMSVGVAHDLKTPLARVSNRLQLMAQDLHQPGKLEAHLENAEGQIQNILRIIQSLLRLGEIESGNRRKAFKQIELSAMLEDLFESYQPVFEEHNKRLTTSIMPNIKVEADKELLIQLVFNLLENIIEHSQDNAQAWIRLQSHRGGAVLQIGDDGPGIDSQDRERIFERFYRADKSRSAPGNGLGLSLVASIAKLHEADLVLLDDQPGAVFDLYLQTQPRH